MGAVVKTAPNKFTITQKNLNVNPQMSAREEYLCSAQRLCANYVKHYALKIRLIRAIL